MTTTRGRTRPRLAGTLILALAMAGVVASPAAGSATTASTDRSAADSYNDPRSGAALNREAALNPGPAQSPSLPAPQKVGKQPVNDPSADATAQDTQSETSIAVDGKKVVIAYNDSGEFLGESHFTGYSTSSDGGKTFTDRGALPDSTDGDAGDPVLAVDHTTGTFYLSALNFNTGTGVQVYKSNDGGVTFGAPVNGAPGYTGTGNFQDKAWMTVDNVVGTGQGSVYLCWTKFGSNAEIRFTRSTDGAASFKPNLGVLIVGGSTQNQGCDVIVGPDHSVYVFYFQGAGGDNKLFVRKSTDFGVTFGAAVEVADLLTAGVNGDLSLKGGLRSNSFPHSAVNPVSGELYVAFNDNPAGADTSDSYLVASTDGGASWSPRVQLNDDDSDRDQFFPTVGVNTAGTQLMVGYYSRSHDPSNFAFHRRSRIASITGPGALVWQDSFQVGPDTPIVIGQDPVINTVYMGDYDQIVAGGKHFQASWADNRYGNSFHANQPDVFQARVLTSPATTNIAVKSKAPATKPRGEEFIIKVKVSNTGATNAKDVYLSDVLPSQLKIRTAILKGEACDTYGQLVSCLVGGLAPGAHKKMRVIVSGTSAGTFSDSASTTTSSADSSNADDSDSDSVIIT